MQLIIARHGETIENAADIIMGHNGGTLSKKGISQAQKLAEQLNDKPFDQVWASDLKRCVGTAKYILAHHPRLELQLTSALREVNYGEFQGRPGADIRAYFEQEGGYNATIKVPGGESQQEMSARVLDFVNNLFERCSGQQILVVTHNGPIETIRAAIERTSFTVDAENGSVFRCVVKEALQLYAEG